MDIEPFEQCEVLFQPQKLYPKFVNITLFHLYNQSLLYLAFKTVILFFAAKPDLGLICISNPFGIVTAKPVGMILVLPGSILTSVFIFAAKSIPEDPIVSYFGNETSLDSLLINIFVIHQKFI